MLLLGMWCFLSSTRYVLSWSQLRGCCCRPEINQPLRADNQGEPNRTSVGLLIVGQVLRAAQFDTSPTIQPYLCRFRGAQMMANQRKRCRLMPKAQWSAWGIRFSANGTHRWSLWPTCLWWKMVSDFKCTRFGTSSSCSTETSVCINSWWFSGKYPLCDSKKQSVLEDSIFSTEPCDGLVISFRSSPREFRKRPPLTVLEANNSHLNRVWKILLFSS